MRLSAVMLTNTHHLPHLHTPRQKCLRTYQTTSQNATKTNYTLILLSFLPPHPAHPLHHGNKQKKRIGEEYRASYGDATGGSGIGVIVPEMQGPLSVPAVSFTQHGEHGEKNYGNTTDRYGFDAECIKMIK